MNCLITKAGRVISCDYGQDHDQTCKRLFDTDLLGFLKDLVGVRIKIHNEQAAVECYGMPSEQQIGKVNGILRKNAIFTLVTSFRGGYNIRTEFKRPIRKLSI